MPSRQIESRPVSEVKVYAQSARNHSKKKLAKLRKSVERHGIIIPLLVDGNNTIVDGHARFEIAKALGLAEVPAISLASLPEADVRALRLAVNRLAEEVVWDPKAYATNSEH